MNGYMRRGQMGSTISAHTAGSLFMRLDSTVFKYTYDAAWAGKTLYFKFQSVNNFGNCPQDVSTLPAVQFTVPGLNPGTVSASTGIVTAAAVYYPHPVGNPVGPAVPISILQPAEPGADSTVNNTAVPVVNPSFESASGTGIPGWTSGPWAVVSGGVD
jgi:hypothetical protein